MDHHTHGCADRKAAGIGYRVIDPYEFDREAPELNCIPRLYTAEVRIPRQAEFLQLVFDYLQRQLSPVYRDIEGFQKVRNRAYVVLVSVSEDDAAQLLAVCLKIFRVGDNKVYPEHILIRKPQSAVDKDHIVPVFEHREVFSDLSDAPEGYHAELLSASFVRGSFDLFLRFLFFFSDYLLGDAVKLDLPPCLTPL